MTLDQVWAAVQQAWRFLPFPVLFLYLIALSLLWLFVEYQATRFGRAFPGWRRPVPILPMISVVAVWMSRLSRWAIWIWVLLFIAYAGVIWAQPLFGPSPAIEVVGGWVAFWQVGYRTVVRALPAQITSLLPGFAQWL